MSGATAPHVHANAPAVVRPSRRWPRYPARPRHVRPGRHRHSSADRLPRRRGRISAPPPPTIVNAPGALGIPTIALTAYRNAEQKMAAAAPGCGISWNLLAGIGRIESMHANGGATDARGTAVHPIYGPSLDGTLAGNEVIVQSVGGGRVTYARAMGPMQFLPGTWARYASDGDGDGKPTRRTCSTPRWPPPATCAAAGSTCATRPR